MCVVKAQSSGKLPFNVTTQEQVQIKRGTMPFTTSLAFIGFKLNALSHALKASMGELSESAVRVTLTSDPRLLLENLSALGTLYK